MSPSNKNCYVNNVGENHKRSQVIYSKIGHQLLQYAEYILGMATVLKITFDNWTLSGQYTECLNKFLFIRTNCPDKGDSVKILLTMAAEALKIVW